MAYDLCGSDANKGFPVNIQGTLAETDLAFKSIQASPDVYITFGRSTSRYITKKTRNVEGFYIMDNLSGTEINYNGISYNLVSKQVCKSTHSGSTWPKRSGASNQYDLIFTFRKNYDPSNNTNPSTFLFVIPIYTKVTKNSSAVAQSDVAKGFFEELVKLTKDYYSAAPVAKSELKFPSYNDLFNALASKNYVYYQSCIQLRPPPQGNTWRLFSQSIGVCYFVGGLVIDDFNSIISDYAPLIRDFRFDATARNSFFTAKRLPATTTNAETLEFIKNGNNWSADGEIEGSTISVGDPAFTKRFRWISEGIAGIKNTARLKNTLEYQCMPINKIRDIDGQLVLLDPLTGTRALKEEIDGSEADKAALADIEKSKNSMKNIAAFIGSVCATIVLLVGGSFLIRWILNRVNTNSGKEAVAAAAVSLAAINSSGAAPKESAAPKGATAPKAAPEAPKTPEAPKAAP